jgi:hypothetical protein
MSSTPLTDAWDREVTVSNGLLHYRNRAIDIVTFSDLRVKGKRVLINNFKENTNLPRANIICKDAVTAKAIYDYIIESVYPPLPNNIVLEPTLWSFLGCSRRR